MRGVKIFEAVATLQGIAHIVKEDEVFRLHHGQRSLWATALEGCRS